MKGNQKPLSVAKTPSTQLAQAQTSLVSRGLDQLKGTARATQIGILVVNDFEESLRHICNMVNSFEGIRVVGEAETGIEAVEQYEILRPDVVIMNVSMPEMDGIEATRIITERHPNARITMLTVRSEAQLMRAAKLAGALNYLLIPPSREELESTIRDLAA